MRLDTETAGTRGRTSRCLPGWAVLACFALAAACTASQAPPDLLAALRKQVGEIAALPGEPSVREAIGVSARDRVLDSLELRTPADVAARRLVIVAGLDGDDRGIEAALGALRWFKREAPAEVRRAWAVSAVPCGNPDGYLQAKPTNDTGGKPAVNYPPADGFFNHGTNVEARYLWRWLTFQAPDLVLVISGGRRLTWRVPPAHATSFAALGALPLVAADTLPMSLSRDPLSGLGTVPSISVEARETDGPALLRSALTAAANLPRSPLREAVLRRTEREPKDVAGVLVGRYPQRMSIAYIPCVAVVGALRLGELPGGDARWVQKARDAAAPYLAGQPALEGNPDTAKLAGYLLFAELAERGDTAAKKLALEGADLYLPEKNGDPPRFGRGWTDDMFMTCCLLGRAGKLMPEKPYHELMARMLADYAEKLQKPSGVYIHAAGGPHAWGRGNGFASLGLMEGLTYLRPDHPLRARVLASYRKQMNALREVQSPDGTWRQVIDRPESYREVTATAMNLAAMARGIRLGWLDASYRQVADRAWRGLLPRIAEDGSLTDVCTGTGAGPSLRYYYERQAVSGFDDRGGAMCLLAALEMLDLRAVRP